MSTRDPASNESDSPPLPFSPQEALAFMQKMWNPLGIAMPGFAVPGTEPKGGETPGGQPLPFPNPALMFAALDPAELERKLAELRIVENWLQMTLSMMQMSIKTVELQKASLEAMAAARPGAPSKPGKP